MKISGAATINAPVEKVWEALLDPGVLVRTIPGCERLQASGENAYAMTVTAGVAAIKGTYSGTCELRDLHPHESLTMKAQGSGAPGTIAADVHVRFADDGDGATSLTYDADTIVGGMIGGVGQRMLSSVSKRMAAEFFGNVERVLIGIAPVEPAPQGPSAPGVYQRPAAAATDHRDFLRGVAVGAGLVLAGVFAGAVLGRRR